MEPKTPVIFPPSENPRVPQPEAPFFHCQPLQIRFNDIDMLGHLNNGIYLQFMDLGKARYFNAVMPEKVDWHHINVVVVNINVNFYSPTYLDENIAVMTAVVAMSQRSFTMEQRIVNTDTGDVKCVARTIMAGFDMATAQSAPIDKTWVDAISAYEQRRFTPPTQQ